MSNFVFLVQNTRPDLSRNACSTEMWLCALQLKYLNQKFLKDFIQASIYKTCAFLVAQLCSTLCDPIDCSPPGSSVHGGSPGKNTWVGCHALLQRIFPTPWPNTGLPHCMQILYHLSHQRNPRILEWVAYPFSRGSSWPRDWTQVSCIAGGFFTSWATREAPGI